MPGIKNTLSEFKTGQLRSGSKTGPVVKNKKQALAIALSEEDRHDARHPTNGRFVARNSFHATNNPNGSRPTQ